jgi:hypothetical protein
MSAAALDVLAAVRAIGGDVKIVASGRLKVVAPAPLADELIEKLRAAKPDLLTVLTSSAPTTEPAGTWREEEEERAAIVEYDGGAPRAWAEAMARLDPNKPLGEVSPQRWLQFVDDCGRFLDGGWALRAAELGWGPLDLVGCDREQPLVRREHIGLLWLVNGGTIRELRRDGATIETPSGARQSYQRRPVEVGRVVPAWELSS